MAKVTFALDDATVQTIRRLAVRRQKPQSHVVREAIAAFAARGDELGPDERKRKLHILEQIRTSSPTRSAQAVDAELREARTARRAGWRRRSD
jgi:predicted transcriptional regulator